MLARIIERDVVDLDGYGRRDDVLVAEFACWSDALIAADALTVKNTRAGNSRVYQVVGEDYVLFIFREPYRDVGHRRQLRELVHGDGVDGDLQVTTDVHMTGDRSYRVLHMHPSGVLHVHGYRLRMLRIEWHGCEPNLLSHFDFDHRAS